MELDKFPQNRCSHSRRISAKGAGHGMEVREGFGKAAYMQNVIAGSIRVVVGRFNLDGLVAEVIIKIKYP